VRNDDSSGRVADVPSGQNELAIGSEHNCVARDAWDVNVQELASAWRMPNANGVARACHKQFARTLQHHVRIAMLNTCSLSFLTSGNTTSLMPSGSHTVRRVLDKSSACSLQDSGHLVGKVGAVTCHSNRTISRCDLFPQRCDWDALQPTSPRAHTASCH
jgi:hypothetical protein